MKVLFSVSALVLISAGSALANGPSVTYSSPVDKILGGHGQVGEAASSASNPDVTYEVGVGGIIHKKNSKYGTVEAVQPTWRLGMSQRQLEKQGG